MEYLFDLGFSLEEINNLKSRYDSTVIEKLEFFQKLIQIIYHGRN